MASTRSSSNLHTVVSGLHLIFTIASVAFLSFKVYHLECELSLIRGKVSLSAERDVKVTEVTPLSADSNNEELRSERNREMINRSSNHIQETTSRQHVSRSCWAIFRYQIVSL